MRKNNAAKRPNKGVRFYLTITAPDLKHKTLFMAAVTTGLRQGELLGLKGTDIDWFNNQIHVNRTYNHFRFYEPKTKTSNISRIRWDMLQLK